MNLFLSWILLQQRFNTLCAVVEALVAYKTSFCSLLSLAQQGFVIKMYLLKIQLLQTVVGSCGRSHNLLLNGLTYLDHDSNFNLKLFTLCILYIQLQIITLLYLILCIL